MIQQTVKKDTKRNRYNQFLTPIFFISFFLYIWLIINPELYYQRHEPVFFFDKNFFYEFLTYPGGLVEYISAFLSQFYFYSWVGAIIITIIALLISLTTKSIIESFTKAKQVQFVHLIPSVLLLVLHNSYNHPLSLNIGLLIALVFINLFTRIAPQQQLLRLLFNLVLTILLYFIAGGNFFLFALMSVIFEFSQKHSYLIGLSYLVLSAIIPYIASKYFFIIQLKDSYLHSLDFKNNYKLTFIPYILYLFFPFIIISFSLYTSLAKEKIKERIQNFPLMNGILRFILQVVIIFAGGFLLLNFSFDSYTKTFLRIDYYARRSEWNNVLSLVTPQITNDKLIAFHFNRALFHTGKLSENMFTFPQPAGIEGLFLSSELGSVFPLQRSDIFFELGYLNESQHYACEALAHNGYTPWVLQRLTLINIMKGEDQVAHKCLNLLDKTLLFSNWSRYYRNYLNDKSLIPKDIQLSKLQSLMPKTDFISLSGALDENMKSLLQDNKKNKMAFEYMMAYYLLTRRLNKFINHIDLISNFGYTKVPRHYEEAILSYIKGKGREKFQLPNYHPSTATINDFKDLLKILGSYHGDKEAAYNAITSKFNNTYWPYLLYK